MNHLSRLIAALAICTASAAHAESFQTASPIVVVGPGAVGFVLHGPVEERNVARVLEPGTHAKVPFFEKAFVMNVDLARTLKIRVDGTLSDGTKCWIEGSSWYTISDALKAFEWRRERKLPLDTLANPQSDYASPSSFVETTYRTLMASASAQEAANGAVHLGALDLWRQPIESTSDDGTRLSQPSFIKTNCHTFAKRTTERYFPAALVTEDCAFPGPFRKPITYPDRSWKRNERATLYAESPRDAVLFTKDQARIKTEYPRIGLRPIARPSSEPVNLRNRPQSESIVHSMIRLEMEKLASRVNQSKFADAMQKVSLADLADRINPVIKGLRHELVEISFDSTQLRLTKFDPCADE